MRTRVLTTIIGIVVIGGCSRTESGDVVIKRPSRVDIQTTPDTLRMKTKTETVDAPVIGTQPETIVVKKPVVSTKKKVIQVPQIQRP
jgi:hypothetical protein